MHGLGAEAVGARRLTAPKRLCSKQYQKLLDSNSAAQSSKQGRQSLHGHGQAATLHCWPLWTAWGLKPIWVLSRYCFLLEGMRPTTIVLVEDLGGTTIAVGLVGPDGQLVEKLKRWLCFFPVQESAAPRPIT